MIKTSIKGVIPFVLKKKKKTTYTFLWKEKSGHRDVYVIFFFRRVVLLCTDICGCRDCTNAGTDNEDADGNIGQDANDSQDSDIDLD